MDRRSRLLSNRVKGIDDPVQLLLEVIYQNGNILNVIDVSDKPEEYFKDQYSMKKIRQEIAKYSQ